MNKTVWCLLYDDLEYGVLMGIYATEALAEKALLEKKTIELNKAIKWRITSQSKFAVRTAIKNALCLAWGVPMVNPMPTLDTINSSYRIKEMPILEEFHDTHQDNSPTS